MSEFQVVSLPRAKGFLRIPANMEVEMEHDDTLMFYPPGEEMITLRISCLVVSNPLYPENSAFESALKRGREECRQLEVIGDRCIEFDRKDTEQDGEQLDFRTWTISCKDVVTILTVTVVKHRAIESIVKETLESIPAMIESIHIGSYNG